MKLRLSKRIYKMSDALLNFLAGHVADSAERDAVEMLEYGVNHTTITNMLAARTAFNNYKQDIYYFSHVMMCTANKNNSRTEVLSQIKKISGRARNKFGENSAKYRMFDTKDISESTDNDLVRIAISVITAATELLPELTDSGLTQGKIDDLAAINTLFDSQINLKIKAIKVRDSATDERIRLGNELYSLIVNICDNGKLCWEQENEAKYNDYVIYKTSNTQKPQYQTSGTVSAESVVNTTVSGIESNTEITLENTSNTPLHFFFAIEPTDTEAEKKIIIAPQSKQTLAASEIGYNEAKNLTRLNVFNPSALSGSYSILWE